MKTIDPGHLYSLQTIDGTFETHLQLDQNE